MDKSAFLAAATPAVTEVPIAAMGKTVRFQVMTGKARDEFNAAMQTAGSSPSRFAALIVAATVVDDTGALMFAADDLDALASVSSIIQDELSAAAMSVNKLGVKPEADAAI